MAKRLSTTDKQALNEWNALIAAIKESTHVDFSESQVDIERRRTRLECNPEQWFKYYFEQYYKSEPADFHIRATKRIIKNKRFYDARAWSRELAKSARAMMEITYLALTGECKNVLLISNSADNAERLLLPFYLNFQENQRIIQDYGEQKNFGSWEASEFITRGGCAFRSLGAGQSPRGTRNKNFRADVILFDDIDTDEECRKPERVMQKWKWIEEAVIPTLSVSGNYRIIFNGNIIGIDCCMKLALAKAKELQKLGRGHAEVINIRDKHGVSVWKKNSEEDVDFFLSLVSASAAQKEFFNNPIVEGEVFSELTWGRVPPLHRFKFLIVYGDPAPGESKNKASSTKAVTLMGKLNGKTYIIKCFLDQGLNTEFIDWYVKLLEYVGDKVPVYCYMENNKLQDPFFTQVFTPIVRQVRKDKGINLYIKGDEIKKTEKATRIEANLEPLNREGNLIFNEAEKDNPHMKRMSEQFSLFTMSLKYPADGPDCVEGGERMIKYKMRSLQPASTTMRYEQSRTNKHRQ